MVDESFQYDNYKKQLFFPLNVINIILIRPRGYKYAFNYIIYTYILVFVDGFQKTTEKQKNTCKQHRKKIR